MSWRLVTVGAPPKITLILGDIATGKNGEFYVHIDVIYPRKVVECWRECGSNWCLVPDVRAPGEPRFISIIGDTVKVVF